MAKADEKKTAAKSNKKDEIAAEKLDKVSGGGLVAEASASVTRRRLVMDEPMVAMPVLKTPLTR